MGGLPTGAVQAWLFWPKETKLLWPLGMQRACLDGIDQALFPVAICTAKPSVVLELGHSLSFLSRVSSGTHCKAQWCKAHCPSPTLGVNVAFSWTFCLPCQLISCYEVVRCAMDFSAGNASVKGKSRFARKCAGSPPSNLRRRWCMANVCQRCAFAFVPHANVDVALHAYERKASTVRKRR